MVVHITLHVRCCIWYDPITINCVNILGKAFIKTFTQKAGLARNKHTFKMAVITNSYRNM